MQFYPTFTLEQILNMTLTEWRQRLKAHRLLQIEAESLFYQLPFINRAANATDEDGKYLYKDLSDVGIDLNRQRAEVVGDKHREDLEKVNKFIELDRRAKRARELARKQLAEKKGG